MHLVTGGVMCGGGWSVGIAEDELRSKLVILSVNIVGVTGTNSPTHKNRFFYALKFDPQLYKIHFKVQFIF